MIALAVPVVAAIMVLAYSSSPWAWVCEKKFEFSNAAARKQDTICEVCEKIATRYQHLHSKQAAPNSPTKGCYEADVADLLGDLCGACAKKKPPSTEESRGWTSKMALKVAIRIWKWWKAMVAAMEKQMMDEKEGKRTVT